VNEGREDDDDDEDDRPPPDLPPPLHNSISRVIWLFLFDCTLKIKVIIHVCHVFLCVVLRHRNLGPPLVDVMQLAAPQHSSASDPSKWTVNFILSIAAQLHR
jgi:hypothetical protein